MIETFLKYGQWVVLLISVASIAFVSSTSHKKRLQGYILTTISRLSGALLFVFVDLYAFVIANIIQSYIAIQGYIRNKRKGE